MLIRYAGQVYGLEVKSFADTYEYRKSLRQAACYRRQLGLDEITLTFFIESVDDENRAKYEAAYEDEKTGVVVRPVCVMTRV